MSKALIYTANTAGAEVAIGNTIPVGSIIRRYGRCIDATGSAINLGEPGYYLVDVSATVTITTATTQIENLSITALVRVMCCDTANLSVQVGGTAAPTIENMAFRTVKVV